MNSSAPSSNENKSKVLRGHNESIDPKKVNKFTGLKVKSVPNVTKRKRTNYRLRKIIIPKSPLMVLNEMIGSVNYVFVENSAPSLQNGIANPFTAQCTIDGRDYQASGPSKQIAKNLCAEHAIQAIVSMKCKDPNNFRSVDVDGNPIKPYQMEDETPWSQLSSLALFKLFNDWQVRGFDVPPELLRPPSDTDSKVVPNVPTPVEPIKIEKRPPGGSKKMPDNPTERHPVQLLNEIQGGVAYNLIEEKPTNPVTFVMSAVINGITFEGEGKNKKDAKRNCALAALKKLYGIIYPVRGNK